MLLSIIYSIVNEPGQKRCNRCDYVPPLEQRIWGNIWNTQWRKVKQVQPIRVGHLAAQSGRQDHPSNPVKLILHASQCCSQICPKEYNVKSNPVCVTTCWPHIWAMHLGPSKMKRCLYINTTKPSKWKYRLKRKYFLFPIFFIISMRYF